MIDSIFDDMILSSTAVTNIVGNRVRPVVRDEKLPCISFKKDDESQELNISGEKVGITEATMTVTSFSKSYSELKRLVEFTKAHLLAQKGVIGDYKIHLVNYVSDNDDYDNDIDIYYNDTTFTIYFEG